MAPKCTVMKTVAACFVTMVNGVTHGGEARLSSSAIEGRIVDLVTRRPVPNAIAVARWWLDFQGGMHASSSCFRAERSKPMRTAAFAFHSGTVLRHITQDC